MGGGRPIIPSEADALVQNIHNGLFEEPLWDSFLCRLQTTIAADSCALYIRDSKRPVRESLELFAARAGIINTRSRYLGELYRLDPIPYDSLHPGRVYSLEEFVGPANAQHQTYMNELMRPSGISHLRIVRVQEGAGYTAWLIVWRAANDFGRAEANLLADLAPHLAIALRNYAALERERVRAGIAEEAVGRLNFGWITLDQRGHVVELDNVAERLLQGSPTMRHTVQGRLFPAGGDAGKAFAALLRRFAENPESRSHAIHLSDEPWIDMLLVPMRNRKTTGAMTPAIIGYIHGDSESSSQRIEQLVELFGLSRSEGALALALARGRSIAEAGAELGITVETARFYTKRIYSKTGTRGQADLVRVILTGVLALA